MLEGFYLELRVNMQNLGQLCMDTHVQGFSRQVTADQHHSPLYGLAMRVTELKESVSLCCKMPAH